MRFTDSLCKTTYLLIIHVSRADKMTVSECLHILLIPISIVTVGDCPMFRRFYVQKVLCSENICSKGSMFRRFYIQKVLCSEGPIFRRSYIQKVLCSEGPMFRKTLFKRSYIQKVLCSEGPIFRYIQKVLYSENYLFYVGKNF